MAHQLRPQLASHPSDLSMPWIAGHAYLTLTLETADGSVDVDPATLQQLGISPELAFDQALEWLRQRTPSNMIRPVDTVPDMFFIQTDDGQSAARLAVLPELYDTEPLGGILAAVPNGNQLLCVPVESVSAVQALRVLAGAVGTAYEHATNPISDQLFWHDGSSWSVVHVDRSEADITVLPPQAFFARMRQVAAMDLVRVAGEA